MCGIIAYVGDGGAVRKLVSGLENLEYRGYDSAGIAVRNGDGLTIYKNAGKISDLKNAIVSNVPSGSTGVGHTRWSTHGPPTDENAHPHTGETDGVAVVHNGIIENYAELRDRLEANGRTFTSDTDTEVLPHLIEEYRPETEDVEAAFRRAVADLEGSYAVVAVTDEGEAAYAARQDSPLVVGLADDEYFLASDVPAFLEYTSEVCYLEDGDVAVVTPETVRITDENGEAVTRETEVVDWDPEETGKGEYDHHMLKEIHAQPDALEKAIAGRVRGVTVDETGETAGSGPVGEPFAGATGASDGLADGSGCGVRLEEFPPGTFEDVAEVQFVACGTSYHASMYGTRLLNGMGVPAHAYRASEYSDGSVPVREDTLVVAVTQSGETADTLQALRAARAGGARTLAVTNVTGSTAAREVDTPLYIRAGPEIGVAATKTFSSQVATLGLLAERIGADTGRSTVPDDSRSFLSELQRLPDLVDAVVRESRARSVARRHRRREAYFFIGDGVGRPVALEGALKFKEITYEHAEGFAAGELKHGPLALVTPKTTVFAVFTGGDRDEKTLSNTKEVQARGADIVAVAPEGVDVSGAADETLRFPGTHPDLAGLLANVQLQLVSYHTADLLNRSIDKPRNLAKSVTVE